MGPSAMVVLALLAGFVLLPLVREYVDLRSSLGLSRRVAVATTFLVFPAFAAATALTLPLALPPPAHWAITVATTLALYSLATRAIVASASSAGTAPSRSTRG